MVTQLPISRHGAAKNELRTQFAALCFRQRKGKTQILLVTSRRTKRWIVPKGWPMEGKTPGGTALQEAWEEAGVTGKVVGDCLGAYSYTKEVDDVSCLAMLYPIEVKNLSKKYPEASQRKRRWVGRKKGARLVAEPELARMIREFDPGAYKRRP